MATINDYIFENILTEEIKLNKLSNQLGKIILTIYNSLNKIENSDKYDKFINILKEMRVEMLVLEKKFYNDKITAEELKKYFSSYVKALRTVKSEFSPLNDKKINRALDKMEKLIIKLEDLKNVL